MFLLQNSRLTFGHLDTSAPSTSYLHHNLSLFLLYHNLSNMSPLVDETVISGEPIVYKLPDPSLKPDVRLDVFDQQFHAHSAILRIYSAFFRTFLDSPDKTSPLASASFRYDYVSVVDDDGTWGLEVVRNSDETCDETSISHRGNDPEENYNGMIGSTKVWIP